MRPCSLPLRAVRLGALLFAALGASEADSAESKTKAPALDLKAGQELTIPVAIVDGRLTLGPTRPSKLGTAQPKDGEITVGLTPGDKTTLLSQVLVTEKTSAPVDFIATGLIGEIKIDERVICGRTDAPVTMHIGSVSWRVSLNTFTVGKGDGTCE